MIETLAFPIEKIKQSRIGEIDFSNLQFGKVMSDHMLIAQLTAPVRWTQTVQNMVADGANTFIECGPGNVLQGLVKKINKEAVTASVK